MEGNGGDSTEVGRYGVWTKVDNGLWGGIGRKAVMVVGPLGYGMRRSPSRRGCLFERFWGSSGCVNIYCV